MRGLDAAVWSVLDRRLRRDGPPVAVALSGGGDSLALTLIADGWARARNRELLVLTVDHGLRPESIGWTARCEALAARLDRPFRALAWEGEKPAAGLPAAARDARHRLLASAARAAGAQVILMGHTADDLAEARAMRAAGSTTPDAREWAPSPAWPDGRGLFVLRPLLGARRADLRAWLTARGEAWIDDPANDDLQFARARARRAVPGACPPVADDARLELARLADHRDGAIHLVRRLLRREAPGDVVRLLGLASVCAGGGARRPATPRLLRLADALRGEAPVSATLAGARIRADAATVAITRESGEFRRQGATPLPLPVGETVVWDGRFLATARAPGLVLRPVAGVAARLSRADRHVLQALPAGERGALPAVFRADGTVRLAQAADLAGELSIACLVRDRFEAAAGLVQAERAAPST